MKWNVALLIAILVTVSPNLAAQRGGAAGFGHGIAHGGVGMGSTRPGFSYGFEARWDPRSHVGEYNRYRDRWSDGGWNPSYGFYDDYWDFPRDYNDESTVQPGVTVFSPGPQTIAPTSPPPPPPTPVIHEYSWPESGDDGGTAFTIILKNGTAERAIAVWVQDNRLCFNTPDGTARQILLDEVDRQNTSRINSEQKLKLTLPSQVSTKTAAAPTSGFQYGGQTGQ